MKILHAVLSQDFYGSERYCIELAMAQARAGHEVGILVRDEKTDSGRAFGRMIAAAADRPPVQVLSLAHWCPDCMLGVAARQVLKGWRPDIVHSHLPDAARRIGRTARKLGIPNVATLHIKFDPEIHRGCDGVICIAAWQRDELPKDYAGEVALVANWLPRSIDETLPRVTAADIAGLRAAWRADDSVTVFGCAGRLMPDKGMDRLIRCFRAAFPLGTEPARLVVAGEGPMRDDIEELCGRDARVFLCGMQTDIAAVYRAIDVYVSAARFEPFGLAIVEAMAAGLPLILTRTEGPREFVSDPRVRWAEPADEATLVEHMRAAAAAGRERYGYDLSAFAPERALAAIEAFYGRVLARRGKK